MNKVVSLSDHRRSVNHELCRQCPHDAGCTSVCIAIETLVQLAKQRSPLEQLGGIYNISTYLDLENSLTGHS